MTAASVSLFDNEREANRTSAIEMIDAALIALGHIAMEARVESAAECSWRIGKGSAVVHIDILPAESMWTLRVSAVVMTCTGVTDPAGLHRHLLTLNHSAVSGAAFALDGNRVLLFAERSTEDLDQSEAYAMIHRVQQSADTHDDELVARFGGVLGAAKS